MTDIAKRTHDGVSFRVESFEIEGAYETKTKYQSFYGDYALTDIEETRSGAILRAIYFINMNREKFNA